MAHKKPVDPDGLPQMILELKRLRFPWVWRKIVAHDKQARKNRRAADALLLQRKVAGMKLTTEPDQRMPDKPYWFFLRINAARTAGFDLSDTNIKSDISKACDENDDDFFRELADQLSDPKRPNNGVIRWNKQLERKWIADNWVRLHYCNSSLPGLCWFTVPALVEWLGATAKQENRGRVAYSAHSYNNALREMGLRKGGAAPRNCRIIKFVAGDKLCTSSVSF